MSNYNQVASDEVISKTVASLKANDIDAEVVDTLEQAKDIVLNSVPTGSRVFTGTSVTLEQTGLTQALNQAPYVSVRGSYAPLYGQKDKAFEMHQLASASDVTVSSVHAITQDGRLMIASRTGSQIPSEAFGAGKVIFVVGAQKLVKDLADGLKRIEQHTVPLEDKRAQAAYGTGTKFHKLLVINSEEPGRIRVIIVKQNVGF